MHTGPIFLAYKEEKVLEMVIAHYRAYGIPCYTFTTEGVHQVVYQVAANDHLAIEEAFRQMEHLYIADGHHRAAAARRYAKEKGKTNEEAQYFLGVAFPKADLCILPYNRVLTYQEVPEQTALFERLQAHFTIQPTQATVFVPEQKHQFGMRYQGQWYCLTFKGEIPKDPVAALDVALLQDHILEPLFQEIGRAHV